MKDEYIILDTNIFLTAPNRIKQSFSPKDSQKKINLIIPHLVIGELAKIAEEKSGRGAVARAANDIIDKWQEDNHCFLHQGIDFADNYSVQSMLVDNNSVREARDMFEGSIDDCIISFAKNFAEEHNQQKVLLVSLDRGLRNKARSIPSKLVVQKWKDAFLGGVRRIDDLYKGWVVVKNSPPELVSQLRGSKKQIGQPLSSDDFKRIEERLGRNFFPNEFVVVQAAENNFALGVYLESSSQINPLYHYSSHSHQLKQMGVEPINPQQMFYLEALLNHEIGSVFGLGVAGAGKTFLSVASSFLLLQEDIYQNLFITRPITHWGETAGYLPGDIKDKYSPFLAPILDSTNSIQTDVVRDLEYLEEEGRFEFVPLEFILGRTLKDGIHLVDGAQNMSPFIMRGVGTRAGHNLKQVVTGDPDPAQRTDNTLDLMASGLVYWGEKSKTNPHFATIVFDDASHCVRSETARYYLRME